MQSRWKEFAARYPIPQAFVIIAALVWAAISDHARDWALVKLMAQPYLAPFLLLAFGCLWLIYWKTRPPRFDIVCEPSHHPYRQEWDAPSGLGHQILFRVGIKNLSTTKAINKAEVVLTSTDPFAIPCIPAPLRLMNEEESVRSFFLPPNGIKYVDVIQQSQPNGNLILWHGVQSQPKQITPKDYSITITAFGDNAEALSKRFDIVRQGGAFALKASSEV